MITVMYENHPNDSRITGPVDVPPTVAARWGTGGGNTPLVQRTFRKSRRAQSTEDFETWVPDEVTNTLNCFDVGDVRSTDIVVNRTRVRRLTVTECDISNETFQLKGIEEDNTYASTSEANAREILHSLQCKVGEEAFTEWGLRILNSFQSEEILRIPMYGECIRRTSSEIKSILDDSSLPRKEDMPSEWMRSLWERGPDRRTSQGRELAEQLARQLGKTLPVMPHKNTQEQSEEYRLAVRRLTPTEVERLQGFPDGWTDVRTNTPDSPRYKAIGNSMAVPVMRHIGNRIRSV